MKGALSQDVRKNCLGYHQFTLIDENLMDETCGSKDYGPDGSGGVQRFIDDAGER